MAIRLVLLGLLQERPLYGYEIKQLIEQRMGDWTDIKFGSIYFSLDKLTKEGFIRRQEEVPQENRPKKIVYAINDKGREEFLRLVRQEWRSDKRDLYRFDLAIYNMKVLPQEEVRQILTERIRREEEALAYLDAHEEEFRDNPYIPPQAYAITDHTRRHRQAEKEWMESLLARLDEFY